MDDFMSDKINCLIGTYSIFSEGIDIPKINLVFNITGNAGKVKTLQMLGRGLRTSEKKNTIIYYDFLDEYKFFKAASYKRMRAFKKEGYKIEKV